MNIPIDRNPVQICGIARRNVVFRLKCRLVVAGKWQIIKEKDYMAERGTRTLDRAFDPVTV
jgi:hypothetical protein